jgi:transcriptional regulator with XRE-family HTH domain
MTGLQRGVLTSDELAGLLGVSRRTLSDWVRAKPEIRRARLLRNRWSVRDLIAAGLVLMNDISATRSSNV